MRRLLAALLCATTFLCLCACGHEYDESPALLLRYADNQPKDYPTTKAAEYFAQLVEERTGGQIRIRVYADAALGDEISVFELTTAGCDTHEIAEQLNMNIQKVNKLLRIVRKKWKRFDQN